MELRVGYILNDENTFCINMKIVHILRNHRNSGWMWLISAIVPFIRWKWGTQKSWLKTRHTGKLWVQVRDTFSVSKVESDD